MILTPIQSIGNRWQGLTSALSGIFCASLGDLDEKWTVEPLHAFRPDGVLNAGTSNLTATPHILTVRCEGVPHRLRYAVLPSENVCTENLTPFVQMLPCKMKSGITPLLAPRRLFDADWHGISIDITSWHNGTLSLRLIIGAVLDPVRLSNPSSVKGETSLKFGVRLSQFSFQADWSFMSLFDAEILQPCSIASLSQVHIHQPVDDPHIITPPTNQDSQGMSIFDLKKGSHCPEFAIIVL
jgi:phosphatidylinositol glycan class T